VAGGDDETIDIRRSEQRRFKADIARFMRAAVAGGQP